MDVQMKSVMQSGHEAFYEGVLRYKNPYEMVSAKFWFRGWDAACEEHRLFTSNQEFALQVEQLQKDIDELKQSRLNIDEELHALITYIELSNIFTFSREKIKKWLKGLVSRG